MSERRLLMIPGPIIFEPSVLRSLSKGHLSHMSTEFTKLFAEVLGNLKRLLFVDDEFKTIVLAGSGTLAMEASTTNFIRKDDNVLVISNGVFGDRMAELLSRYPVKVDLLKVNSPGEVVDNGLIEERLKEKNYSLVAVTHVDTSTAVRHNIEELGHIVKDYNALLVVDGVCSVAGEEIRMKDWNIDVVLTGSQKAIGVPVGLALIWLSPRALDRLKETNARYAPYYMDFNKWIDVMDSYEQLKPIYFATPAVNLIVGLHESLKLIFEEGLENRFRRHRVLSEAFRKGVRSLGLNLLAKNDDIAASTVTAVYLPENIDLSDFRREMASRNVIVAGGLYPSIKTRYFRVGHMGPVNANDIASTMATIERSLVKLGYPINLGDGLSVVQRFLSEHGF